MVENPDCSICGKPLYYTGQKIVQLDKEGLTGTYTVHHCLSSRCPNSKKYFIKYKDGRLEEMKEPLRFY